MAGTQHTFTHLKLEPVEEFHSFESSFFKQGKTAQSSLRPSSLRWTKRDKVGGWAEGQAFFRHEFLIGYYKFLHRRIVLYIEALYVWVGVST